VISPAFTEGEAGQPPESNDPFARNFRAEQVWNEVIRIRNGCPLEAEPTTSQDGP
jgi:hypothetical protein